MKSRNAILIPGLVAAAVAIGIQCLWTGLDSDVSWLLTVCDRMLSGDRLYVDIIEVNPPASVWLYLPLVWIARGVGLKPEAVVAGAFVLAGLASTLATVKLAGRLDDSPSPPLLSLVTAFVVLVLPMGLFAQREHAALLLAMPSLALLALIAEHRSVDRAPAIVAGVAAGLIVVLKPYFALALMPPAIWTLWRTRCFDSIVVPVAAASAVVAVYAVAVLAFAGAYFHWVPIFAHTYLRMHAPPQRLALSSFVFVIAALIPAFLLRPSRIPPLGIAWGLGAAGFALAALAQAKNYANHWFPAGSLAILAAFAVIASPYARRQLTTFAAAVLVAVSAWQMRVWDVRAHPAVETAIRSVAPPHPRMTALSRELTSGHPVTRNVDGWWVGSRASLFTAAASRDSGRHDPLTLSSYREDIHAFATDVLRQRPDVVLVDRPDKDWLLAEPEIAAVMDGYRPAARAGNTEIWLRR